MIKQSLYLHIGLPKTGSTAIQNALYTNRDVLLKHGILYPRTALEIKKNYGANHRIITQTLLKGDLDGLLSIFNSIDEEASENTSDKIIVSHEGMSNHYYDFQETFLSLIDILLRKYKIIIVMVVRPLSDFFFSYYKQNILNPPINDELGYGSSLSPSEFFKLERIQKILNYDEILKDIKLVSQQLEIQIIKFDKSSLLGKIKKVLEINDIRISGIVENVSLSDDLVEKIRELNADLAKDIENREIHIADLISKNHVSTNVDYTSKYFDIVKTLQRRNREIVLDNYDVI